jgi:regulatory protein
MKNRNPLKAKIEGKALLLKLQNYCAYQERSQHETREKIYAEQTFGQEAEQLISKLIEEGFLNEERFALAYAGGKFRMKQWGRNKIRQGLKLKRVPGKLIEKALNSIDNDTYIRILKSLLTKKDASLKEKNPLKRKQALLNYAVAKGYERDIIYMLLRIGNEM